MHNSSPLSARGPGIHGGGKFFYRSPKRDMSDRKGKFPKKNYVIKTFYIQFGNIVQVQRCTFNLLSSIFSIVWFYYYYCSSSCTFYKKQQSCTLPRRQQSSVPLFFNCSLQPRFRSQSRFRARSLFLRQFFVSQHVLDPVFRPSRFRTRISSRN